MTRHPTVGFSVTVVLTTGGLLLAVFAARPEIAVLSLPWLILLVMGLAGSRRPHIDMAVEPASERSTVGDSVDVVYRFRLGPSGARMAGTLYATWPDASPAGPGRPGVGRLDAARPEGDSLLGRTLARPLLTGVPVELTVPFTAARWGTYDAGVVKARFVERFGLFVWSTELMQAAPVRFHPDELQLRQLLVPTRMRRKTGVHQSRLAARGMEFAGVRPHSPGDSLRDVNWRASARSHDLWVSERHPDRSTDVVLLLDSFPESYGIDADDDGRTTGGQAYLLDLVVRLAMAVAARHLALTDRVGLVELGGIVRWVSPAAGRLQLYRLFDAALATSPYHSWAKRDLSVVPRRAIPPTAMVIGVSPLVDDRFVNAVVELAGGGADVAVVSLEKPVPEEVPEALRLMWSAERQMARDVLANHGIAVARWNCELDTTDSGLHAALDELSRRRQRLSRAGVGPLVKGTVGK